MKFFEALKPSQSQKLHLGKKPPINKCYFTAFHVKLRVPETNGKSSEEVMDELDRRMFLL